MRRILDTLPSLLHSLDDSYALARGVGIDDFEMCGEIGSGNYVQVFKVQLANTTKGGATMSIEGQTPFFALKMIDR